MSEKTGDQLIDLSCKVCGIYRMMAKAFFEKMSLSYREHLLKYCPRCAAKGVQK